MDLLSGIPSPLRLPSGFQGPAGTPLRCPTCPETLQRPRRSLQRRKTSSKKSVTTSRDYKKCKVKECKMKKSIKKKKKL